MKSFAKICLVLLAALTLAGYSTNAQTDSSSPSTNKPATAPARQRGKAYNGTIASVDNDAKTFTVTLASGESQTIHFTSTTRIKKDGAPGTSADIVAGQKVRGTERKNDAGDWVASTVNLGEPKPRTVAPPAAADKQ
jgi:hypothetical protein